MAGAHTRLKGLIGALAVGAVALIVGAAALLVAFEHWKSRKLSLLEPKTLSTTVVWRGPSTAPCRMLMVGDSRIADWPLIPPPGWEIGKLGFPGEASGNIAAAALPLLALERPDAVLIQAGTNDATVAALIPGQAGKVLEQAGANVVALAKAARNAGARTVIVMTIAPPIAPGLSNRLVMGERQTIMTQALSRRLDIDARRRGHAVLAAENTLGGPGGRMDIAFRRDDLHWTPAAYRVLDRARNALLPMPSSCV